MQNRLSTSISAAMLFALLYLTPSLAFAQPAPAKIFAFTPFHVLCMRPAAPPCSHLCIFLSFLGLCSCPTDGEGLGIEAVMGQCDEDDRIRWTRWQVQINRSDSWLINATTGKCLHVQGTSVVQRTCDFTIDPNNPNNVTHPQLWTLNFVKDDNGLKFRQLMHQQIGGGVMCLATNSIYPFYVGTMSLDDCIFPPSNAPVTEQFVSVLW